MLNSYDVFISYARADGGLVAAAISQQLVQRGFLVFSDQDSTVTGQVMSGAVERALSASRAIILLLSRASVSSQWVNREIAHALRKQTNIVPVVLDRSALDSPIGSLLGDRSFIDVSEMSPPAAAEEVVKHLDKGLVTSVRLRRLKKIVYPALMLLALTLTALVISQWRFAEARRALATARKAESENIVLEARLQKSQKAMRYLLQGINFYQTRQYARAVEMYDQAIELDPNNAYIYDLKGYALFKLGEFELSVDAQKKSVTSDPNYVWGYFDLARTYCAAKNYSNARDAIASALKLEPELKQIMQKDGEFAHVCEPVRSSFK